MITNPILTDEFGKKIYKSQETEKQPSQMIYESKFMNYEELKFCELAKTKLEEKKEKQSQLGPFFISMVDGFRLNNRIMDHLNEQFENEKYESLKKESPIKRHVC